LSNGFITSLHCVHAHAALNTAATVHRAAITVHRAASRVRSLTPLCPIPGTLVVFLHEGKPYLSNIG